MQKSYEKVTEKDFFLLANVLTANLFCYMIVQKKIFLRGKYIIYFCLLSFYHTTSVFSLVDDC